MSEALPSGHAILNHLDHVIYVTQRSIRIMDMHGYIRRDRPSGLLQIKPELMDVMAEMEYGKPLMRELGPDCSGPMVAMCKCRECRRKESDIDQTLTPQMQDIRNQEHSAEVVRKIKANRERA